MTKWQDLCKQIRAASSDENFLKILKQVGSFNAKILSIAMIVVLLISVVELIVFLINQILLTLSGNPSTTLIELFGLFLNVLVALAVLENITVYLKRHVIQVELVITASLIVIARKIIIFDAKSTPNLYLGGLALIVAALSFCYWLVRRTNQTHSS
ncbi:phosphate-starvation-inducible PsiE family protein [Cyanobacteria bacterium FACHB-DQ100]|nr:phosphate-starvation-inducible PsiE family protein [Cyanobacteria bacterium FACHB-DQ100]